MKIKYILLIMTLAGIITTGHSQIEEKDEDLGYEGEILDTTETYERGVDYSAVVNFKGMFSTEDELPFWMSRNKVGRVAPDSNISTWITGKALTYLNLDSFIEVGAGLVYFDGVNDEFAIDELYAHYEYKWLQITAGQKHEPILYNGLSATNENMLWSLNHRPLPGLQIATNRPIFFSSNQYEEPQGLGIEAAWEEYFLGNDRYVEGAMLHHKNLRLVYRSSNDWEVKAGIHHFAQWGGKPGGDDSEKRPSSFSDYLEVITGQGGESGLAEDADVLANHLGSYEFFVSKQFLNYRLQFIYNHIFEDSWGMGFGNFPDGRYGIYYEDVDTERLFNSFILEYYTTRNQRQPGQLREYFSHGIYRSGWTYMDRIMGAPFFTPAPDGMGIDNNKFSTIHFGTGGRLPFGTYNLPYKLLVTYDHREGSWTNHIIPNENVIHTYVNATVYDRALKVNLEAGADLGADAGSNFGAGLHLVYEIEPQDF
ncbi:capsule assembly Wzi family protein [Salinimicrobium sediminilitoris]|uniref:capsule assembly Wzi family protein n=1 Tax=Salinimicrobium sediminilitoris TaxID=2876715 RepID=UPI001E40C610|nr:capsule assembly Wzi family protein [Salinimicrobium sediminilitoris]MCC8358440.1 capsule assembly Wzi family protein [Salinimicrobium sediminilitoris]